MKQSEFPEGRDEARVRRVLDHYEQRTEGEAVAEDEAAYEDYPPMRDVLLETRTPSAKRVRLPAPAVEREYLPSTGRRLPYAPAYGQDTDKVLQEAGFSDEEIAGLRQSGTLAWRDIAFPPCSTRWAAKLVRAGSISSAGSAGPG